MKKPAYEAAQTTPQRGVVYSLCAKTRAVNLFVVSVGHPSPKIRAMYSTHRDR